MRWVNGAFAEAVEVDRAALRATGRALIPRPPVGLSSPCDEEPFPAGPIWHVADVEQVHLGVVEIGGKFFTFSEPQSRIAGQLRPIGEGKVVGDDHERPVDAADLNPGFDSTFPGHVGRVPRLFTGPALSRVGGRDARLEHQVSSWSQCDGQCVQRGSPLRILGDSHRHIGRHRGQVKGADISIGQ